MRELSLFTGAGGGLLGTKLLGWTLAGCVEWEDYCQRLLRQRMEDGHIETAPIFGDIRTFISEGYAASYQGMVDIITAGFPCQPFSTAGKQLGADDPRNMWPATLECISIIRPRFALLENVPSLLASGYFGRILGDLAKSGYDVKWVCITASSIGAIHKRERIWIACSRSDSKVCSGNSERKVQDWKKTDFARVGSGSWRGAKPELCGVGDDLASRMDRLKAIGNGQVPAVVRAAWELLSEDIN